VHGWPVTRLRYSGGFPLSRWGASSAAISGRHGRER
jgi:hypothetical protein